MPNMATASPLGPVELIVRDIDEDGQIATVGVSLEPELAPRIPLFQSRREIMANLRRWYRARRARRKRRDAGKAASVEQPPETAPAEPGPPETAPPEAVHEPASTAAGEAVRAGAATPQSSGSSEPDAQADVVPAAGRTELLRVARAAPALPNRPRSLISGRTCLAPHGK